MAVHNRLRRIRGNASNFTCPCGEQAKEWAYRNQSAHQITDREGRRYSPYAGENLLMDDGKRKCRTCVYARNRKRPLTPEQKERKNALQRLRRRERNAALATVGGA